MALRKKQISSIKDIYSKKDILELYELVEKRRDELKAFKQGDILYFKDNGKTLSGIVRTPIPAGQDWAYLSSSQGNFSVPLKMLSLFIPI